MFWFKLKIYFRIISACWNTFGFSTTLLRLLIGRPAFSVFNDITLLLDNIFFRGYRSEKIKTPVFIIGHPRSGTTFLHRLLNQTREFVAFEYWELMFPSLTARKIVGYLIKQAIKKGKGKIIPEELGHKQHLDSIEEEELLFYKILNTQFVALLTPLGFSKRGFDELVLADQQPEKVCRKSLKFFEGCLKRQMFYLKKKQIVANLNYSGMRIRTLLEAFPDAKIIYLMRSPKETIPSHLSLDRNIIDYVWGLDRIPSVHLDRYFMSRYRYDIQYYQYIRELFDIGILNSSRCLCLSFETLKADLNEAMDAIVEFSGIRLSKELKGKIHMQMKVQKDYRPSHQNLSLADFNLDPQKLGDDLNYIFDNRGLAINLERRG